MFTCLRACFSFVLWELNLGQCSSMCSSFFLYYLQKGSFSNFILDVVLVLCVWLLVLWWVCLVICTWLGSMVFGCLGWDNFCVPRFFLKIFPIVYWFLNWFLVWDNLGPVVWTWDYLFCGLSLQLNWQFHFPLYFSDVIQWTIISCFCESIFFCISYVICL